MMNGVSSWASRLSRWRCLDLASIALLVAALLYQHLAHNSTIEEMNEKMLASEQREFTMETELRKKEIELSTCRTKHLDEKIALVANYEGSDVDLAKEFRSPTAQVV